MKWLKKIPGTTVKQIDSNANIFMELKAGTIDGAIIDNAVAMYYLKQGADKDLKLVGEPTKSPRYSFRREKRQQRIARRC